MNRKTLEQLNTIANDLDSKGFIKAANLIDEAVNLLVFAQQSEKSIHVSFSKEGGKVVCTVTVHEKGNPAPLGPELKFHGQSVDAARKAAMAKISALKTEHGVDQVLEQFSGI